MIPLAILEPIERPLTAILEWLHSTAGFRGRGRSSFSRSLFGSCSCR